MLKDSGSKTDMEEAKQHQPKTSTVAISKLLNPNNTSSISKRHSHSMDSNSSPSHQANNAKMPRLGSQALRATTREAKTKTPVDTVKHHIKNNRISIKVKLQGLRPFSQEQGEKE